MKKWKQASYLCLPVLAFGIATWAAAHGQDKDAAPKQDISLKQEKSDPKSSADDSIPAVPEAQAIQDELQKVKTKAVAAGRVSCCIRPACDFCISHLAMCQCRKNLLNHKPVCRECKGGWAAGDGHMDHVMPGMVKVMKTKQVRKDVAGETQASLKKGAKEDKKKPDSQP